jgi:transcriptional regulator with XRE-family HTH domain
MGVPLGQTTGLAVKALRDDLGLSQEKIARLLGVSTVAWQQWERGISEPRANQYVKILLLDVSPERWAGLGLIAAGHMVCVPSGSLENENANAGHLSDVVTAARALYEAAENGSGVAGEALRDCADSLRKRAGDFSRAGGRKTWKLSFLS